ncbi:MAG: response regulator, partial [Planctomycetes bacterium]|nr:response regulator [Planctomycetota bacterium]
MGEVTRLAGVFLSAEEKRLLASSGLDTLTVIAEQKRAIEEQMAAQTRLLEAIENRLVKISQYPETAGNPTGASMAVTQLPVDGSSAMRQAAFGEYLLGCMDFVAARMRWYKAVVDNVPFPVQIVDNRLRWIYMNKPSLDAMGCSDLSEVVGQPCTGSYNLCGSDSCVQRLLARGIADFEAVHCRNGRVYKGRATFFNDEDGRRLGHIQIMQDVTDMKEKERELALARDAAEESARAKSEFLANMSHEVRTPMNAILGLSHLTLQTELTEQQVEFVHRIETAAQSLLRIINDILDFSKIEAGKLDLEHIDFQMEDVLKNTVGLLAENAHAKGLEFIIDVAPNTPDNLIGDPSRLSQVLTNLVSNAVKFTEVGEVTVSIRCARREGDEVVMAFMVKDTGIGLTKDQSDRLFSAFTQADSSITRKYGGTGLGLAISRQLVELMGGTIWCDSVYGQGSAFGFTARFGLHQTKRPLGRREDFAGMRALVVDDNPTALGVIRKWLQSTGFSVITAESGLPAGDIVTTLAPATKLDLIMVDWKMPGLDGVETGRRLLRLFPPGVRPVIIMMSSHSGEDFRKAAADLGVDGVLAKPISSSALFNAVLGAFGRSTTVRSNDTRKVTRDLANDIVGSRILLVEDNDVNQLVASRILRNAGLEVDIARNGREALEAVGRKAYHLVLMDIQMPEMDGMTATAAIRRMPGKENLPIVAMTAHAMQGDREQSLGAGMNDHISKPIDIKELFSTLTKWITAHDGEEPST